MTPSFLILSRHFPPHVSGGARRPYGFARALQGLGGRVFVCAPALPEDMPGVAVPHPNPDPPSGSASKAKPDPAYRQLARDLLLWPDPDIRWAQRAGKAALEACPFTPDWVFTTSPPESVMSAGLFIKQKTGSRWIHDFRDHWLQRPFRQSRRVWWRAQGERMIAKRWLAQCDGAIMVNDLMAEEIKGYAPSLPYEVVQHFSTPTKQRVSLPTDQINIVHTGSFQLSDPETRIGDLLEVLGLALQTCPDLRLHLVGRLSEEEHETIGQSDVARKVDIHGVKSLEEARAFQEAADALVLVASPNAPVPPGKTVEYESAGPPIIAIGAKAWIGKYNGAEAPSALLARITKGVPRQPADAMTAERAAGQLLGFLATL